MAEITLEIGSETRCSSNTMPGEVKSVVVDRGTRTVTHLVVEPRHREGLARLVPLDHVDAAARTIQLRYTEAEFKDLSAAEETLAEILPGPGSVELLPEGWRGADDEPGWDGVQSSAPVRGQIITGTSDLVPRLLPATEEEERRGDHVHATDGAVGELRALSIDPDSHQVTHVRVLLKEGLWRHKEVAIPADRISGFGDGINLSITKQEVQDLAHEDADNRSE
jgi:sporulation protein YlmC with PRC-barrel domain